MQPRLGLVVARSSLRHEGAGGGVRVEKLLVEVQLEALVFLQVVLGPVVPATCLPGAPLRGNG